MELAKAVLKEPKIGTVRQYARRVRALGAIFLTLFLLAILGDILLISRIKIFVTLAQRSNVETLTLAFLLIFFTYLALVSSGGAWGVVVSLYFGILGKARGKLSAEKRKQAFLAGPSPGSNPSVALNRIVELEGHPHEAFELMLQDEAGSMGTLRFDGGRIKHCGALRDGSNSIFAFAVEQINDRLKERGDSPGLEIVEWSKIDDEETEKFLGLMAFAQQLEKRLGCNELWPKITLTTEDRERMEDRLSALCRPMRTEALLPHWEYGGNHKLPIIPEPLGIISLSRSEKRVDPLTSMGASLVTVTFSFAILIYLLLLPPWVPGK